jgi:Holliday junction resolvase RusA-like endonuclease
MIYQHREKKPTTGYFKSKRSKQNRAKVIKAAAQKVTHKTLSIRIAQIIQNEVRPVYAQLS